MGIFEEMGFCDNLDFLSGPPGEMKVSQELEPVGQVDEDYSDEEMDVDELEKRMWRDRMRLKRLKEQKKTKDRIDDSAKQRQSQEQARRKKMSRAQDGILNGWMDGELTQQQHCPQFDSPAAAALPAIAAACR